ncbi:MAG: phasin family protein [Candidatus Promineifilaceae bacterium]
MTEKIEVHEEMVAENGHNSMLENARKVLLAGIGAVALAQEEVEEFVNKLVDRGQIAEKDGRKLVHDIMERRRSKAAEVKSQTGSELDRRVEDLLARLNIPTKSDIEALNRKVAALSKKIDDLKRAQS